MDFINADGMTEDERQLLLKFLKCVSEHPEKHRIVVRRSGSQRKPIAITLEFEDGYEPPFSQPILVSWDPLGNIARRGFLESNFETSDNAYELREAALEWYRLNRRLSDEDVRRQLGLYLFKQYQELESPIKFDDQAVAKDLGIEPKRLKAQLKVLTSVNLIKVSSGVNFASLDPSSGDIEWALPHSTYVRLTEPKGIEWAIGGFPDLRASDTQLVHVDVNVTLQQYIQQVESLHISQADKDRFELLLRRIEEEGGKESPSYKPVQDALDMLSKVRELAPIGIKFFSDHFDTIQRMAGHLH